MLVSTMLMIVVPAMLMIVVLVACSDDGESADETSTTATLEAETTAAAAPATTDSTETTPEAPVLVDTDLSDVTWVVFGDGGLVDDRGRLLTDLPSAGSGPAVTRTDDGGILFATEDGIFRWTVGRVEPEPAPEDATIDRAAPSEITAGNGITVRIVEADVTLNSDGSVDQVLQPAQLEVLDPDGVRQWTTAIGGVAAHLVSLIDFDGRNVLLARTPDETTAVPLQHVVHDLACTADEGCSRSFVAPPGSAALVGPDTDQTDINPQLPELCPTGYAEFITPVDVPTPFDQAYQRAGAILASCDTYGVGYHPGLEAEGGGWLWTELARALQGPHGPVPGTGARYRWSPHPDRASVTMADAGTSVSIDFEAPDRRRPGMVAVTMDPDTLLVSGQTDEASARAIRTVATRLAGDGERQLVDWLTIDGPERDGDEVAEFVEAVDDALTGAAVGEVQLTDDGVAAWNSDTTAPDEADEAVAFAFGDFAAGGEGSFDDLPLADEVLLAVGSQVHHRQPAAALADRRAWSVNATSHAELAGPFNLLTGTPAPARFTIGPHDRCALSAPLPAPPELAGYRRISIQPAEDSIDSCLLWRAIELFVADGRIVGVTADAFGP